MDASEIPKSRKVMFLGKDSETNATTSMMTAMMEDTQDKRNVTEVALALVEDAIAVAVQFVEEARNPIKNIKWITHGEFTVEKGRKQIEKFVLQTWEYQSRWVHHTEFIKKEELSHTFRYIYCVRWSIPTAQVPMPRVSATAYFTIKINKSKPPDTPIDVSYIFEGHSLVLRPGMAHFREEWPRDIIEAKNLLMESITF
ncbi:A-kinase anchor protein 14 [Marmota flaviventris]|uniref:A-kinase anchor protein 14 n=1 Tax=Marmota flaviventris TaxID=93162 RepID=UPI000FFF6D77|nr:A-kinase anchor protein 14 [Marmota flaviventris]